MELTGIHHVTAVSGNAQGNVDFYTRVLGLRLVKKTVNQDDTSAYHLFYGDEVGHAGTEMTFFEWRDLPRHVPGAGDVETVSFVVPSREALEWWQQRFDAYGVQHGEIDEVTGHPTLRFTDPEGQRLALVVGTREDTTPWKDSPVPNEFAIRGLGPLQLMVAQLAPTAHVLTEVLGFRQAREYPCPGDSSQRVAVFETGPGGPSAEVHVHEKPDVRSPTQTGIGGVHHVAFRTPNDEEHRAWRERVARAGLNITPVIDRYYFRSLYFREPGGVLFELATDGPGFATDEDVQHLGEALALPPFLEGRRAEIEAGLEPVHAPRGYAAPQKV